MTEPLTREEREELRATLARLITAGSGWYSLPKETMGRLLADLERVEKERDDARARLARIVKLAQVPDVPEPIPQPILLMAIGEILAIAKGER